MKKLYRVLKKAGEYFTIGAGVATICVSVVAAFVAPPVFLTFVVAAGVGLICAGVGGYYEAKNLEAREQQIEKQTLKQDRAYQEMKKELDEIKDNLEQQHHNISLRPEPLDSCLFLDRAHSGIQRAQTQAWRLHSHNEAQLFSPRSQIQVSGLIGEKKTSANDERYDEGVEVVLIEEAGPRLGH